jgi:hypothetical protein
MTAAGDGAVRMRLRVGASIGVTVGVGTVLCGGAARYEGPYVVTPRVEAQSLATKDRLMYEDVTVAAIPEYLTSNSAGGYTCNIG